MDRIFIDGFEGGDLGLWPVKFGTPWASTGISGMSGNYCASFDGFCRGLRRPIPSKSEIWAAFLIKRISANQTAICSFVYDGVVLGLLYIPAGTASPFQFYRYNPNTVIGASTTLPQAGTVYRVEVRYKPHNTDGIVQVKIGGILEINFVGNTSNGGSSINQFGIGSPDGGIDVACYIDDVVLDGAEWVGNSKIQGIKPTVAGNSTQWTPSAGNNWECVDDTPPLGTDYVKAEAADLLDLYGLGNLAGAIDEVKCIQVQWQDVLVGNPTATKVKPVLRTGGTNYEGTAQQAAAGSAQHCQLWETNPNTSAAWAKNDVDGLEAGIKSST